MNGFFYKNYKFYSFCSHYNNFIYICQNDVNYINDKLKSTMHHLQFVSMRMCLSCCC